MERRGVVDVAIVQVLPVSISNKGGMINWQLAALAKGNITTLATFNRSTAPHAPKRCHKANTKRCAAKDVLLRIFCSFLQAGFGWMVCYIELYGGRSWLRWRCLWFPVWFCDSVNTQFSHIIICENWVQNSVWKCGLFRPQTQELFSKSCFLFLEDTMVNYADARLFVRMWGRSPKLQLDDMRESWWMICAIKTLDYRKMFSAWLECSGVDAKFNSICKRGANRKW